jgi:hypothetical protein
MNFLRYVALFALLLSFTLLTACTSKKEQKPVVNAPPAVKTIPVASQDKVDADAAAAKVLAQFKAADFASIYKEASSGFQEVGTEGQFVAAAQKTRAKTGPIKDIKEVNFYGREDKFFVHLYHVQYEKVASELRLTFGRSKLGKMLLTGLNQKDIAKKK